MQQAGWPAAGTGGHQHAGQSYLRRIASTARSALASEPTGAGAAGAAGMSSSAPVSRTVSLGVRPPARTLQDSGWVLDVHGCTVTIDGAEQKNAEAAAAAAAAAEASTTRPSTDSDQGAAAAPADPVQTNDRVAST
eukprot:SAG31_NODE_19687_length_594_cov_1.254545_1_plen_136_part_00